MTSTSPIWTPAQAEIESRAAALLALPEVRRAQREGGEYLLSKISAVGDAASHARFADAVEQAAFFALLQYVNRDPLRPRFHSTPHWAHTTGGTSVPATMIGIPNPDCIYRFAPVSDGSAYVIRGRFSGGRSPVNDFSLVTRKYETLANVNGRDLVVAADGTFTITLDPRSGEGLSNHLQMRERAAMVLVRDTLPDWETQLPSHLDIERLEDGARTLPVTPIDATGAADAIRAYMDEVVWGLGNATSKPVNVLTSPEVRRGNSSSGGYLVTQAYSPGHYRITDDEALIVRVWMGATRYMTVPLSNVWSVTGDSTRKTVSYNHTQAHRDTDGSHTFVLSMRDPGVPNWLDPDGLSEGILFVRWSAFDEERYASDPPTVESRLVRLDQLWASLPAGTPRVDAAERARQLAERARQLRWRRSGEQT